MDLIVAPAPGFRRDAISMRTKTAGLDTTAAVPGLLYAWARSTTGGWIGLVHLAIPTGNRAGYVEARQWRPAHALTENEARPS